MKKQSKKLKKELTEKFVVLITSAFGLVAALAWNSAMQKWFEQQAYLTLKGPWVYAILVTILAVLITFYLGRLSAKL